jgi:hypothetical protein
LVRSKQGTCFCREENGFAICFLVPDGKKEPANNTEVGLSIAVRNVLEHPKTGQPYLEVMYQDHTVSVFTFLMGLALGRLSFWV